MRGGAFGLLAAVLVLAGIPAGHGAAFTLPAEERLYPYAVGTTPSTITFFLNATPSNIIFDYVHVSNTWATQTFPTKTGADSALALDAGDSIRIHWVVQSHTALLMTYRVSLTSDGSSLADGEDTVLLLPEVATALDFELPPLGTDIDAGDVVALKVERRLVPTVGGWQAFAISEHLWQSYVELPVA